MNPLHKSVDPGYTNNQQSQEVYLDLTGFKVRWPGSQKIRWKFFWQESWGRREPNSGQGNSIQKDWEFRNIVMGNGQETQRSRRWGWQGRGARLCRALQAVLTHLTRVAHWATGSAKGGPTLDGCRDAHFSTKFLRVSGCPWDGTIKLSCTE